MPSHSPYRKILAVISRKIQEMSAVSFPLRKRPENNASEKKTSVSLPSCSFIDGQIVDNYHLLNENDTVLLLYQMGKVGSSSIYKALREQFLSTPVYYVHYLEKTRVRDSIAWHQENCFQQLPEHLLVSRALGSFLQDNSQKIRWKIISLARDPIALQASIIFQNLEEAFSEIIDRDEDRVDMKKAQEMVVEFLGNHATRKKHFVNWFDTEIKEVFGVDIYDYPFDKERGFSIIRKNNVEILLLKYEKLKECFADAFFEFAGKKNMQLPHANIGSDKRYGSSYRELVASLKIPESLCREVYATKLAQHFYSSREIDQFLEKWVSPDG